MSDASPLKRVVRQMDYDARIAARDGDTVKCHRLVHVAGLLERLADAEDDGLYDVALDTLTPEWLMPDKPLLAAYQRTDGEPGNPEADALLAEIERRNLDV